MNLKSDHHCSKEGCYRTPKINGMCEHHYADVLLRKEKKDGKK